MDLRPRRREAILRQGDAVGVMPAAEHPRDCYGRSRWVRLTGTPAACIVLREARRWRNSLSVVGVSASIPADFGNEGVRFRTVFLFASELSWRLPAVSPGVGRHSVQRGNPMGTSCDPNSVSWRMLHHRALGEWDQTNLLERVHLVEAALFRRWQALSDSDVHREDRREIDLASQDLLRMKLEQLGWPLLHSEETRPRRRAVKDSQKQSAVPAFSRP